MSTDEGPAAKKAGTPPRCGVEQQRRELGRFLRARRARLLPADVGLPTGQGRRTPGLRREEIAAIAGISVTWYARLEQGRAASLSTPMLDAIARVLRLNPAERSHLLQLTRHQASMGAPGAEVSRTLQAAVLTLETYPACLLNARWDVLLSNRAARVVFGEPVVAPDGQPNGLWWMFTDPGMQRLVMDWELHARSLLAAFRASYFSHAGDQRYSDLVEALRERSVHFAAWWESYDLLERGEWFSMLDHPDVGELLLEAVVLVPDGRPDLRLVLTPPLSGTPSVEKLARLVGTPAGTTS